MRYIQPLNIGITVDMLLILRMPVWIKIRGTDCHPSPILSKGSSALCMKNLILSLQGLTNCTPTLPCLTINVLRPFQPKGDNITWMKFTEVLSLRMGRAKLALATKTILIMIGFAPLCIVLPMAHPLAHPVGESMSTRRGKNLSVLKKIPGTGPMVPALLRLSSNHRHGPIESPYALRRPGHPPEDDESGDDEDEGEHDAVHRGEGGRVAAGDRFANSAPEHEDYARYWQELLDARISAEARVRRRLQAAQHGGSGGEAETEMDESDEVAP
ncbi:hypothetical protein BS47DRAFT_487793 [Hydnum rufescens UP504]|uniref:Uncharacterized protein n=1 Tax=Hydnum rufescens UP504 TaxID=1448309 RepID=A0A9P6DP27_9AGAM|nr:hypothetical protein BS47DRAFT_487793 [Hydnum rufescens UP504]